MSITVTGEIETSVEGQRGTLAGTAGSSDSLGQGGARSLAELPLNELLEEIGRRYALLHAPDAPSMSENVDEPLLVSNATAR